MVTSNGIVKRGGDCRLWAMAMRVEGAMCPSRDVAQLDTLSIDQFIYIIPSVAFTVMRILTGTGLLNALDI